MDNFIKGVQAPKVPQPLARMTSVSELVKVTRDAEKTKMEGLGAVKGKSPPSPKGVAEHGPIAPREQSLPLAILRNPKLVQAEWAWRRLLTEVVQQATVRDVSPPKAPLGGEQGGGIPMESATTDHQLERAEALPIERTASHQASVVLEDGNSKGSGERLVPTYPAADPPLSSGTPSVNSLSVAIRMLWDAMSQVAERTAQAGQKSDTVRIPASILQSAPVTAASSDGGTLLSFHALQREHVEKSASDVVRSMVLEDRWVNVTRTPDAPLFGSGLWVPAPLQPGEGSTTAVRWKAERYTKPGPQGQSVHRLRIVIPYDGQPVALQFVCVYPSVSVHVSTDHEALQQRLRQSSARVAEALSAIGWRMDQWFVGAWEGESL